MSLTAAAVLVTAVIGLLNLTLALALIRRLRDHETRLAGLEPRISTPLGSRIGSFSATSTRGVPLSADSLSARATIGVFAPGCEPCHRQLPDFVAYARQLDNPVAVVLTGGGDHAELVARLEESCHVVLEPLGGPVSAALQVVATPTLMRVQDGVVTAVESVVTKLRASEAVAPA
ncbi:TlpA family protein disulfide reductase [Micromonospora sp. WMMD736]|uniref:TlpA family protein disulfide reductase n=1 Tax=Micromonospora sp. WMMD736 TaxID=3404112 RepID=UPI003B92AEAD